MTGATGPAGPSDPQLILTGGTGGVLNALAFCPTDVVAMGPGNFFSLCADIPGLPANIIIPVGLAGTNAVSVPMNLEGNAHNLVAHTSHDPEPLTCYWTFDVCRNNSCSIDTSCTMENGATFCDSTNETVGGVIPSSGGPAAEDIPVHFDRLDLMAVIASISCPASLPLPTGFAAFSWSLEYDPCGATGQPACP